MKKGLYFALFAFSFLVLANSLYAVKYVQRSVYKNNTLYVALRSTEYELGGIFIYRDIHLPTETLPDLDNQNLWDILHISDGLTSEDMQDIEVYVDSAGNDTIIAATDISGVNIISYDSSSAQYKVTRYFNKSNSSLPSDTLRDLLLIDTRCYIATGSGLAYYDVLQDTLTRWDILPTAEDIRSLAYSNPNLWIVGESTVYRYNFSEKLLYKVKNIDFLPAPGAVLLKYGQLYIGANQGLYALLLDSGKMIKYKVEYEGISSERINFVVDFLKNYLLVATNDNGVFRYNFSTHMWDKNYKTDLISPKVNSITKLSANVFIFCTEWGYTKYTINDYTVPSATKNIDVILYPNPYDPSIGPLTIEFYMPQATTGDVIVFDLFGQEVAKIYAGSFPEGLNQFSWDGRTEKGDMSKSDIYVVRVKTDNARGMNKLALTR